MKKEILLSGIFVFLLVIGNVNAQDYDKILPASADIEPPTVIHGLEIEYEPIPRTIFYGLNSVVKVEDIVTAVIDGKACGYFPVVYDGYYGELACVNGGDGDEVSFYVNGYPADVSGDVIFEDGKIKNVEITKVYVPEPPDPGTILVECGSVPTDDCDVTQNTTFIRGTYYLPYGIDIAANDVTLDCNESTLYGGRGTPMIDGRIEGVGAPYNTVIKNCIIRDSWVGIQFSNPDTRYPTGLKIINNAFINVTSWGGVHGIFIKQFSDDVLIENNTFNVSTITIHSSANVVVQNNNIIGGQILAYGGSLEIPQSTNITIVNNTVEKSWAGIESWTTCGTIIVDNVLSENSVGVKVRDYLWYTIGTRPCPENAYNLLIENNVIQHSNYQGLLYLGDQYDDDSHLLFDLIIKNNTFWNNSNGGIIFWNVYERNNEISGNTFLNNTWSDVALYRGDNTEIAYNNGLFNNVHGIYVDGEQKGISNNISIHDNTFTGFGECGIFFYSNLGATNNRVFRNSLSHGNLGFCYENSSNTEILDNTISANSYGVVTVSPLYRLYLNSIYSNSIYNVESSVPAELSYLGYGNYWGHSSPPCFIPGVDSNSYDVVDSYPFCGLVDKKSISIPLEQGWNFVSFNVLPVDTDTETVLMSIDGYYDFVYNYVNGDGNYYDPDIPWSPLTDLYPWYGYWIHMTAEPPNELTVIGDEIADCNPLYLQAGSNPNHLVGYWLDYASDVDDALASFWSTPLDRWNYDYVKGYSDGWKTYDPDLPEFSDLNVMEPGVAYFVKMDYEDELDYICPVMCDDDDCPPGQGCDWRDRCVWNCLLHEDFRCMTSGCPSGYIEFSGPGYECPAGDICCGPDDA